MPLGAASTTLVPQINGADSGALLADIAATEDQLTATRVKQMSAIATWAAHHTVEDDADVCTVTEGGLDTGVPVAGAGAPLLSDFAVIELCATLGRSLDSGRHYVGQVVELAFRLPRTWARVLAGEVASWRALRIADLTSIVGEEAATYVDRYLAPVAHSCTWAQIERLIETALARFEPEFAEERRRSAAEQRRFDIRLEDAGIDGTVSVDGVLDAADALDLERSIAGRAEDLASLGNTDSRDVRRAKALGELARDDLTLDLHTPTSARPKRRGRSVDLVLHISDAAVARRDVVGRLGDLAAPITADQIREWCAGAESIIVRPVIDLADCAPVDAYEVPDRVRRQVALRNPRCAFPNCTRPAEACDCDHITPYGEGGVTCPCNLAPICRPHHRAKTHGGWSYEQIRPGTFRWLGPHGQVWVTDPVGTRPAPDPPDPPNPPDPPQVE